MTPMGAAPQTPWTMPEAPGASTTQPSSSPGTTEDLLSTGALPNTGLTTSPGADSSRPSTQAVWRQCQMPKDHLQAVRQAFGAQASLDVWVAQTPPRRFAKGN